MSIAAKREVTTDIAEVTKDGERIGRDDLIARAQVQEIDPFPELQTRLTRIFGPGPERDMLHQLIYWFSKPKMQNRWTIYKTFQEWRDERGLNRKQVDKARIRLKPTGVVKEEYGPYKRIHYTIDWPRLVEILRSESLYPLKGGQSMTVPPSGDSEDTVPPQTDAAPHSHAGETPKQGGTLTTVPPLGDSEQSDPPQTDAAPLGNGENPANEGGHSNTGEYAGEYVRRTLSRVLSGNSLLQSGENDFSSRPSPPQNKEFSNENSNDKNNDEGTPNPVTLLDGKANIDPELLNEVKDLLGESPDANEAALAFEKHRDEGLDLVYVCQAVSKELYGHCGRVEMLRDAVRAATRELIKDGAA